jgi:dTDP-4-dehydrorhamnose reductase
MRILVTGAAGKLGRDVARAAAEWNHEVSALSRAELDVLDGGALKETFDRERPDAVINCAAYTDVDAAEGDLRAAMDVNAEGARNVAEAAAVVGACVAYISTDYVFDGSKGAPYVETDETRPLSVYGQTKLAGELATSEAAARHFVVRTSWLFGTGGPNFVETMLKLAADHGEVLAVRDQVGCPTYTAHLADAVVRVVDTDAYGIHHIAGTGECSRYEFAAEIFSQAGIDCRLMSCTTEELARAAPRPAYSALSTERKHAIELPDWQVGLAGYLQERVPA